MKTKYSCERDLIARAIILRTDETNPNLNAILVNHSHNAKTSEEYYALPGGHVDPGESCTTALAREIEEELSGKVQVLDMCFVSESIYPGRKKSEEKRHELVLYFHANLTSALRENGKEIFSPEPDKSFQWLPLSQIGASPIVPASIKEFLLRILHDVEGDHYQFSDDFAKDDAIEAQPE